MGEIVQRKGATLDQEETNKLMENWAMEVVLGKHGEDGRKCRGGRTTQQCAGLKSL